METFAQTFERASAMPAPTWHFLKMNDTTVEIPDHLAIDPHVEVSEPWSARGAEDAFDCALADAQSEWESAHPEPTEEERRAIEETLAAEADATYGGTALSGYQAKANALEDTRSLAAAFDHGTGDEVAAYMRYAAGKRIVVEAEPGTDVSAQVVVKATLGAISTAAVDVIADERSTVNLSIVVDSPDDTDADGSTAVDTSRAAGIAGTTVRVFAAKNARVAIARTQALDDGYVDIDDMGLFASDSARIDVKQTVLGAMRSFTGLAGDLRGEAARVDVDTHYLGRGEQMRDFNYSLRHHGPKTVSNMIANGVLAGKSTKTLRGTIDLVRGCKGAEGSERETVLLVDEDVENKTIPIILCSEDDVAGNHGATIGHIRDEQLFYLASRGLSQEAAELMFVEASMERAVIDAADDAARASALRIGEKLSPGFSGLFEEE